MKIKLVVTLNIPEGEMGFRELASYVRDALGSWGGQFHPDHPMFPQNWDSDNVTVVREIKDKR